jgi:hypothetical protein
MLGIGVDSLSTPILQNELSIPLILLETQHRIDGIL